MRQFQSVLDTTASEEHPAPCSAPAQTPTARFSLLWPQTQTHTEIWKHQPGACLGLRHSTHQPQGSKDSLPHWIQNSLCAGARTGLRADTAQQLELVPRLMNTQLKPIRQLFHCITAPETTFLQVNTLLAHEQGKLVSVYTSLPKVTSFCMAQSKNRGEAKLQIKSYCFSNGSLSLDFVISFSSPTQRNKKKSREQNISCQNYQIFNNGIYKSICCLTCLVGFFKNYEMHRQKLCIHMNCL